MRRYMTGLLAVTLLTVARIAAADFIYTINLADPLSSDTATGSLTLSSNTGVVSPVGGGVLVDWNVTATMNGFGLTLGPLTPANGFIVRGAAHASPTEIYVTNEAAFNHLSFSSILFGDGATIDFVFNSTPQGNFGEVRLFNRAGSLDSTGGFAIPLGSSDRFVIATFTATVPEPTTLALLGIALAGMFLAARRRLTGRRNRT